jgi:hypothetical protein
MKMRSTYKSLLDSDHTTYILIGVVIVTVVVGGLRIIFA